MKAAKGEIWTFSAAERVKTPWWFGDTVSPEGNSPTEVANDVGDVLAETVEQVEKLVPPQDRHHKLITDEGATEWLVDSARRWITAMMADEGIHGPIENANRRTKAEIRAREKGTWLDCMSQIFFSKNGCRVHDFRGHLVKVRKLMLDPVY